METVTIKIDKEVKKTAARQARKNGVPLSSFITSVFMASFAPREKLNARTRKELIKISKDARDGKNLSPVFKNVTEMKKYLMK